jgi:hypothetical protein
LPAETATTAQPAVAAAATADATAFLNICHTALFFSFGLYFTTLTF